jgi:hypothetical protein
VEVYQTGQLQHTEAGIKEAWDLKIRVNQHRTSKFSQNHHSIICQGDTGKILYKISFWFPYSHDKDDNIKNNDKNHDYDDDDDEEEEEEREGEEGGGGEEGRGGKGGGGEEGEGGKEEGGEEKEEEKEEDNDNLSNIQHVQHLDKLHNVFVGCRFIGSVSSLNLYSPT